MEKFDKRVFHWKATAGAIVEPQNANRMLLSAVNKMLSCEVEFAAEKGGGGQLMPFDLSKCNCKNQSLLIKHRFFAFCNTDMLAQFVFNA